MSHCATFTFPDGRVVCVGPANPKFIPALLLPNWADVVAACAAIRLEESVVRPYRNRMAALTEEEAMRAIAELDAPGIALENGFLSTDVANLSLEPAIGLLDPSSVGVNARRRFRNAWRKVAGVTRVDMPLARAQRMNEVRAERGPRFTKVDNDIRRAEDQGLATRLAALRVYRQKLRDLPATEQPNVNAITMPEALAAWEPTWPVDPS